ncbi:MAG: hypothetical protein ACOX3V_01535 [Bacillota bacterium]
MSNTTDSPVIGFLSKSLSCVGIPTLLAFGIDGRTQYAKIVREIRAAISPEGQEQAARDAGGDEECG